MIAETLLERFMALNEIGIALSGEKNIQDLLQRILIAAKELTSADGATLYLVTEGKKLKFELSLCDSLAIPPGHHEYLELPLYQSDGSPNETLAATFSAHHHRVLNIEDVYKDELFDFQGPKQFDLKFGYRTASLLTCPLENHEGEVIGILQLVNSKDIVKDVIVPFSKEAEHLALSLSSQAAVALTNRKLIFDLRLLFESLIKLIAEAVDTKSPVMGRHGRRVPILAEMLARAVNKTKAGPYHDFKFTEDEIYALKVASFLHDLGKITTPEYLIEKHSKLEGIFDRMELIKARIDLLKEKLKVAAYEEKWFWLEKHAGELLEKGKPIFDSIDAKTHKGIHELENHFEFLSDCNVNKVPITDDARARINRLNQGRVLTNEEADALSIPYGNLTENERKIIENHVSLTEKLLNKLPFPKDLKRVPSIASSHHERMDGKGYPHGLKGDQIPLEGRILAIADIFEALSAPDRAYKSPLPLSIVYKIMSEKAKEGHIDPDLYDIFIKEKIGLEYAEQYLAKDQIDVAT